MYQPKHRANIFPNMVPTQEQVMPAPLGEELKRRFVNCIGMVGIVAAGTLLGHALPDGPSDVNFGQYPGMHAPDTTPSPTPEAPAGDAHPYR